MAAAKRAIVAGSIDPGEMFTLPAHENLTVSEVLVAQRRWGLTRARKFLTAAHLHRGRNSLENVKICELTIRERRALTEAIKQAVDTGRNGKSNEGDEQDG